MEWATATKVAFSAAKFFYINRQSFRYGYKWFQAKYDLGKTDVVVMGHAGVGKSQLINHFNGDARELRYVLPSESQTVEVDALKFGTTSRLVRTLPGQEARRTQREIEIFEDDPELEGVIFLVDYGFVAPRDEAIAAALIRTDGLDSIEKLREHNLRVEISDFDSLKRMIIKKRQKHGFPSWLLIAVNKVDLFQGNVADALNYYHPSGSGPFASKVRELVNTVGSSNLKVLVVQSCGHIQDFHWNGEVVPSALDYKQRDSVLVNFQGVVASLIEGESNG